MKMCLHCGGEVDKYGQAFTTENAEPMLDDGDEPMPEHVIDTSSDMPSSRDVKDSPRAMPMGAEEKQHKALFALAIGRKR